VEFVAHTPSCELYILFRLKKAEPKKRKKQNRCSTGTQRRAAYSKLWTTMVCSESFLKTSPSKLTKLRACWWNFSTFRAEFSQGIATGLAIVFPLSAVIPYAYCEFFEARVAMIFAAWFFLRLPLDWFSETSLPYFSIASKVIGQRQTKAHACTEHQII